MHRTVLVAAFATTFLVACPPPQQQAQPPSVDEGINGGFSSPFDATLSPDGKFAYFLAISDTGVAGLYTYTVGSSGAASQMAAGDPLVSPLALDVTSDGKTLYIADSSSGAGEGDLGRLLTIDTAGGSLASVDSTAGFQPRGLVVVSQGVDTVYFTGNDPADGAPGVFKMVAGASTVTTVSKGAPFIDPSGVAVANNGDIYVTDTADSGKTAQVLKISGGTTQPLLTGLRVGYPAGIALTLDQQTLMVSALDPENNTDLVILHNLKTGETTQFTDQISAFQESAGLHRAKNVNSFVWADSLANTGGTVYVLNSVAK